MTSQIRILIVDDEDAFVADLKSMLGREGFSVDTANDGNIRDYVSIKQF